MSIRYFCFYATTSQEKRVKISYGVGDIDDAIRHAASLDAYWDHEDPYAGYSFSFESVPEVAEETKCAVLCDLKLFRVWEEQQALRSVLGQAA